LPFYDQFLLITPKKPTYPALQKKAGLLFGINHRQGNPASLGYAVTLVLRQLRYPMDFKKIKLTKRSLHEKAGRYF